MRTIIFTVALAFALAFTTSGCDEKCGFKDYDHENKICNYGRWTSGKDSKEKERAKVIKNMVDYNGGFASESLSKSLIEKYAYCFDAYPNWKVMNPNWEVDEKELKKMEFASYSYDFVTYGLNYCSEDDDEPCEDSFVLSTVKEKGNMKVFHIGFSALQCQ
jgi:hypothetical protein